LEKKLPEAISSEDILREPLAGPVWLKIPVQKVEFLKNLYMTGVEHVFIQTNSEVNRPGIQHFRRQIKSDFKKEFRHITREVLGAIGEGGRIPAYVKPVVDKSEVVNLKGKKFNAQYLELTYKSQKTKATYMTCFTAVESGGYIHTFFSSAFEKSFPDCRQSMLEVFKDL
jgi:hypothetical protein